MSSVLAATEALLRHAPVIPVLTVEGADDAVPLATALVAGGLPLLEVTLRTEGALNAITAMAKQVPGAIVGAGTIRTADQAKAAVDAGATFLVSPGATPQVIAAVQKLGVPFLPGCATASEAMRLSEEGFRFLKFFPAEAAGGVNYLKSLAAPLADLRFCPTGGIDAEKAKAYLALPNVVCVGGSWITPAAALKAGDWATVTRLSLEARMLR
jgi:2-dehydro-3-deoxyphosphogluconate aldolase/(4S)-4-hydroxy-2-oxoglutarate aldolase